MNRIIKHIPSFPMSPSDQDLLISSGLQLVHCDTRNRQVTILDSLNKTILNHHLTDSVAHAHHTYELSQRNICAVDDKITFGSSRKLQNMNLPLSSHGQEAVKNYLLSSV